LKETWPYRPGQPRLGKYCFTLSEYRVASIDYAGRLGVKPSPFDRILVSLESYFISAAELRAAEEKIQQNLERFVSFHVK